MDRKTHRPLTVAEARANLHHLMQRSALEQGRQLVQRAPGQAMLLAFLAGLAFSLSTPLQNLVREIALSWLAAGRTSPNPNRSTPPTTRPEITKSSRTKRRSAM